MVRFLEMDHITSDSSELNGQDLELATLNRKHEETVQRFPKKDRSDRISALSNSLKNITEKLTDRKFELDDRKKAILRLKIARHFEKSLDMTSGETLDTSTLADAIIDTPEFLDEEKGMGVGGVLRTHEQKYLLRIAEIRKKLAERTGKDGSNPWENLFETDSGNYYMARLLNMAHLEMESDYMNHCVGTSDSYINRMKRGEIEILSFRDTPTINRKTGKLEGDFPLLTIEYNVKTQVIEQMRRQDDRLLREQDIYFDDVIETLRKLSTTKTDEGKPRVVKGIAESELKGITVENHMLLTEEGLVHIRDFDPDKRLVVFKRGGMDINDQLSAEDVAKIVSITTGNNYKPEEIAQSEAELNSQTRIYLGTSTEKVIKALFNGLEAIYSKFPEGKIEGKILSVNNKETMEGILDRLSEHGVSITMLRTDMSTLTHFFKNLKDDEEKNKVVIGTVRAFLKSDEPVTLKDFYKQIDGLGLSFCSPRVGLELRSKFQDFLDKEWLNIGMEPLDGKHVFAVYRDKDRIILGSALVGYDFELPPHGHFVFTLS